MCGGVAVRQVFRCAVPVDDRWHTVEMRGPVLHVATRGHDYVELWFLDDDALPVADRTFRVFGTGHAGVEGAYVGTAITPSGRLVWHLFEQTSSPEPSTAPG